MNNLEIICIQSDAFYKLIDEVIRHLKDNKPQPVEKWISTPEAMKMLRIKSKTTLQKLRDEGLIRYSKPDKKLILYDVESINAYLEDFVYEPFTSKRR